MQLLRDNLTLWTSSDSADADVTAENPKKEEGEAAAPAKPAEEEPKAEEPAPAAAS